jgi:glucokinase
MQILAGDIGGTNTRLALFDTSHSAWPQADLENNYPSQAHPSIESILKQFLIQHNLPPIDRACFGIAGPVIDQVCETTNLPWRVDAAMIKQLFDFKQTWLLNDLEANAWGIEVLKESDIYTLNPGKAEAIGNRSIISAGTGLGEAGLYWDGETYRPFPSEGGHSDFSPTSPLEFSLYEQLASKYGHVSWERLVSGPGLQYLYQFLRQHRDLSPPVWLMQEMDRIGAGPAISRAAIDQTDDLCQETLELFIQLYAREAGNHALKIMATGGVYLGGGIAPQILPMLQDGQFMQSFLDKGRMQPIMSSMPVRVILNDKTALLGVAQYAALQG